MFGYSLFERERIAWLEMIFNTIWFKMQRDLKTLKVLLKKCFSLLNKQKILTLIYCNYLLLIQTINLKKKNFNFYQILESLTQKSQMNLLFN